MSPDTATLRIVRMFEYFAPQDVDRLGDIYTQDAHFKDPFHEVQGLAEIQRVYRHMFESLDDPRFRVTSHMTQGDACWLAWDFTFRFKSPRGGPVQRVRGASHLRLTPEGRIGVHRDYWDAAEELYEKLPVVGSLMRWLKRRAAA